MNGSGRGKARRGIGKVIRTVTRLRQNFKSGRMTAKRKGEKVTLLPKTLDGEQKSCYNKSRGKRRLYGELSEWSKVQHSKCCVPQRNPGFESLTLRQKPVIKLIAGFFLYHFL